MNTEGRSSLMNRYLDPASSLGEIMFGLIMTLTFTLGAGIIIDDDLVNELFTRGKRRRVAHAVRNAQHEPGTQHCGSAASADADRQVGAQQVFSVVIEEHPPDRRLEKRRAARVARRVPRVRMILVEPRHRRGQRRHHRVDVTTNGSLHSSADKRCRVLESPYELIDHLHHVDGNGGGFAALGHEENRDLGVARANCAQQLRRFADRVRVGAALRPVQQDAMDARIGDDGEAVRSGTGAMHGGVSFARASRSRVWVMTPRL